MNWQAGFKTFLLSAIPVAILAVGNQMAALFCCWFLFGVYGLVGAGYGVFARRSGEPVDVMRYALGGGMAALMAGVTQFFVGAISILVLWQIGYYEMVAPPPPNPDNFYRTTMALTLGIPLVVVPLMGGVFGAVGGLLYAAANPTEREFSFYDHFPMANSY